MKVFWARLWRVWIWCRRFRYRKGYGVQSPFAFNFIREVLNGKGEYYAYEPLHEARKHSAPSEMAPREQLDRLLLRLANYAQAETIRVPAGMGSLSRRYLLAGCQKAQLQEFLHEADLSKQLASGQNLGFVCLDAPLLTASLWQMLAQRADVCSVVLVRHIYRDALTRRWWKEVIKDPRAVLTFDLYEAGVVLFNTKYIKQHYIVNF